MHWNRYWPIDLGGILPEREERMHPGLANLGLEPLNRGGSARGRQWMGSAAIAPLTSRNPATGEILARIAPCSEADYEQIVQSAVRSFQEWRTVPAPARGEVIRQLGQALREEKDRLGTLIALEVGKIKSEADGEVQEMIDMADWAVGQSRMLYGLSMHSERSQHRMYEQWHPLGPVGVLSAFNFPVAVWA